MCCADYKGQSCVRSHRVLARRFVMAEGTQVTGAGSSKQWELLDELVALSPQAAEEQAWAAVMPPGLVREAKGPFPSPLPLTQHAPLPG